MSWKSIFGGIGKGVRIADGIVSNPVVGGIVSGIPVINSTVAAIHLAGKLFPDAAMQKRAAAIESLRLAHPEYGADELGKLVDAMELLSKFGVQAVH